MRRAILEAAQELSVKGRSDARQSLLESEWGLPEARFAQIVASERLRFAAGRV